MRKFSLLLMVLASTACSACGGGNGGPGTGGAPGSGGLTGVGGQASSGGGTSSGGGVATGGSAATGGNVGAGGETSSGGGVGTGGISSGTGGGASGGGSGDEEWLPSWATTIQQTEESNLPPAPGLPGNTLRQFVWPTVSGSRVRIQLSNEKGTAPVEIQKVHIARAKTTDAQPADSMGAIDAATDAAFTFSGTANVTIPAGQTVWSDAIDFPLTELELTAVSMQFATQIPTEITGHPGARTSSYVGAGDAVAQEAMPQGSGVKERWYFINAIEVMAPADAFAIAALGDSITDGYGVLNVFSRWTDHFTLALKEDALLASKVSVLNFGMGANNLTKSGGGQDSGVIRFGRDVLTREKIRWLIVLEGVNDINGSPAVAPEVIEAAYEDIITQAEAAGIGVFVSPLTPMNAQHKEARNTINTWVRASANYDVGVDFDLVLRDPGNANNTQAAYKNDDLHPSLAGYEAMGQSVDLTLFYP